MTKKNISVCNALILLCIAAITPSFYVFPSYNNPRVPAGKRGRNYPGPSTIRQKQPIKPVVLPQPIESKSEETPAPVTKTPETNQTTENSSKEDKKNASVTSGPLKTQISTNSPARLGWLSTAYTFILYSLSKAFDVGIGASNKNLVKKLMNRQEFKQLQDAAHNEAKKEVDLGKFDNEIYKQANTLKNLKISPEDKHYLELTTQRNELLEDLNYKIRLPKEEKTDILTKSILKSQKIDVERLERETAFSSILQQGVYAGIINTATSTILTLIGLGIKMGLETLMPTGEQ